MPGMFYELWTEAKDTFEYAAGKKVKDRGEDNAHVRPGKGVKAADLRVKKPTKTGLFGQRKSAGIGKAAKGLDQALLREGNYKARKEALKVFSEKAEAYAQQLDEAKNNEYKSVKGEIDALKKEMKKIATRFQYLLTDQIALDTIVTSGTLPTTWAGLRTAFNKAVDAKDALMQYSTERESLEAFQSRFSEELFGHYWNACNSLIVFRAQFIKKTGDVSRLKTARAEEIRKSVKDRLQSFAVALKQSGLDDDGLVKEIKGKKKQLDEKLTRPNHDARVSVEMLDEKKCRDLADSGVGDLLEKLKEWHRKKKAELAVREANVQRIKKEAGIK